MILPLVQGPAGPVGTAAAWSPDLCRRPASRFHEDPSGWAGSCDVPKEQIVNKNVFNLEQSNPVLSRYGYSTF